MNYANPERELLALVYTLDKQGHYLRSGVPVECNFDCTYLEHIQSMEIVNRRLARWILSLQDYNLTVKHISGKVNTVADYLSRNLALSPVCGHCKRKIKMNSVSAATLPEKLHQYVNAAASDEVLKDIWEWQREKKKHRMSFLFNQFKQVGQRWFYGKRIYIPNDDDLKLEILRQYHDLESAGHQGIRRTRARIFELYFWPGMEEFIRNYVRSCLVCQRNAQRNQLLPGLLHPLEIPSDRFRSISVDFAKISSSASGFNQLMVIVDRLTKFVRLIPCKDSDSTAKTARRFITSWYSQFGLPETITSDRDTRFTSKLWDEITSILGIKLHLSTARHQQSDGQSEIAIRTYKRTAKKFASVTNADWDEKVALVEFALNSSISASTGITPFHLAFGFTPRAIAEDYDWLNDQDLSSESHQLLATIQDSLTKAKVALHQSQQQQAEQYNRHRKEAPSYAVGDLVLLSSDGIHWPSLINSPSESVPNYFGPLEVTAIDSNRDNLTLKFPYKLAPRFLPTFHVSVVKPYVSRLTKFPSWRDTYERPLPIVDIDGTELFEVDRVLGKRVLKKSKKVEYLLGFKGYPDSHNQWYPFNPASRDEWINEWQLLQAFDPSVGPFAISARSPVRRSTRTRRA